MSIILGAAYNEAVKEIRSTLDEKVTQKLTLKQFDDIKKAIAKLHTQTDIAHGCYPRETIVILDKENKGMKWRICFYAGGYRSVIYDIAHINGDPLQDKMIASNVVLIPHDKKYIAEHLEVITLYEAAMAISKRKLELGLPGVDDPIEILENVIRHGYAGSVLDQHSPVINSVDVFKEGELLVVSYEHMNLQHIHGLTKDYYRVTREIPLYPTLTEISKVAIPVSPERKARIIDGVEHASNIDSLFKILPNYFSDGVYRLLTCLKEIINNNESSNGELKLLGYPIPILHCHNTSPWCDSTRVLLSEELVEEIMLFNVDLPLGTKGEVIEGIIGSSASEEFVHEVTKAVDCALHTGLSHIDDITITYSEITKNVIVKDERLGICSFKVTKVDEDGKLIGLIPTLNSFSNTPVIDYRQWSEQSQSDDRIVVWGVDDLLKECTKVGIETIQPFIDLMCLNTVVVGGTVLKVMPSYFPTVKMSSLSITKHYLLTKDTIDGLYKLSVEKAINEPHTEHKDPEMTGYNWSNNSGGRQAAAGFVLPTGETMENHQPPFPIEDEIGTFVLKASYYLSIDPYLFMNVMRLSNITPGSVKNAQGLDFVFSWDPKTNTLRVNRNEECVLKQEFPIGAWDAFVAAGFSTGYRHGQHQGVNNMSAQASEGFVKEAIKARRIQTLIEKLKKTKGPEEAYDLIAEFLGDEYEQEGAITYKGVRIKYFVGYTTHNNELLLNLEVNDKWDRNEDPIFQLKTRVKRENIHRVYDSIKHLVKMHG